MCALFSSSVLPPLLFLITVFDRLSDRQLWVQYEWPLLFCIYYFTKYLPSHYQDSFKSLLPLSYAIHIHICIYILPSVTMGDRLFKRFVVVCLPQYTNVCPPLSSVLPDPFFQITVSHPATRYMYTFIYLYPMSGLCYQVI